MNSALPEFLRITQDPGTVLYWYRTVLSPSRARVARVAAREFASVAEGGRPAEAPGCSDYDSDSGTVNQYCSPCNPRERTPP